MFPRFIHEYAHSVRSISVTTPQPHGISSAGRKLDSFSSHKRGSGQMTGRTVMWPIPALEAEVEVGLFESTSWLTPKVISSPRETATCSYDGRVLFHWHRFESKDRGHKGTALHC